MNLPEGKRITVRLNEREQAELDLLKKTFHVEEDGKAIKLAVEWVNHYLKNVTNTFFPPSFDVILMKKKRTEKLDRKVWE
ncbi:hypothetical protein J4410_05645 [Candidatus Woesearchaeota archaeon]|nr:hypothetical protein [Candidatus Woesearchaeota archaeon]